MPHLVSYVGERSACLNKQTPVGMMKVAETDPRQPRTGEERFENSSENLFISIGVPTSDGNTSSSETSGLPSSKALTSRSAAPPGSTLR